MSAPRRGGEAGGAPAVGYRVEGPVATLTLDRPENRNALSPEILDGLGDGLAAAAADPGVRVVVLTHTGPAFCSGADLKGGAGGAPRHGMGGVLRTMLEFPKPVVARVGGHCAGGGIGLAAAADIAVAAQGAHFAFREVRIGVAPAIISVVCLARMRRGDALEMFLTGDRFDARRAAEVGLVNRAVPDADLDAEVGAIVESLLAGAPGALAAAKELVNRVPAMGRREALEWAARRSAELFASDEARAGMAAFARAERPPWAAR